MIQFFLAVGALLLTVYFFTRRRSAEASALVTLAFCAFVLLSILGMLVPRDVTRVAHLMDVGRGTDLLLYGLVCAFALSTITVYFRFQDTQQELTRLARAVALDQARRENAYLSPGPLPAPGQGGARGGGAGDGGAGDGRG
ncbi:MAG: DUF2304 family protein [Nocardioides sp.]